MGSSASHVPIRFLARSSAAFRAGLRSKRSIRLLVVDWALPAFNVVCEWAMMNGMHAYPAVKASVCCVGMNTKFDISPLNGGE